MHRFIVLIYLDVHQNFGASFLMVAFLNGHPSLHVYTYVEAYAEGQEDENSRDTGATIISRELAK